MKLNRTSQIGKEYDAQVWEHTSPASLNYTWNTGSYVTLILALQIITGIVLSMWYVSGLLEIWPVLESIYWDTYQGWVFRYLHCVLASLLFVTLYVHLYKNMFFGSFMGPKMITWQLGIVMYFLIVATAFLGYTLPFGQMSLWAATVITNLLSAIPVIGDPMSLWIRGDFTISDVTISRFFALHVILPFLIVSIAMLHVHFLHKVPSTSPKDTNVTPDDKAHLSPYAIARDAYGLILITVGLLIWVLKYPDIFVNLENFVLADSLVTPEHIVPEWYLCHIYAMVRSTESKSLGVVYALFSFIFLFLIPNFRGVDSIAKESEFFTKLGTCLLFVSHIFLIWVGEQSFTEPFNWIGEFGVIVYFASFICFVL